MFSDKLSVSYPNSFHKSSGIQCPKILQPTPLIKQGAAVFASSGVILREDLEEVVTGGPGLPIPPGPARVAPGGADPYDAPTFEEFKNVSEKLFIELRLARNDGNIKRTAEELGMQRSHLYKKLDRYGLR